MFDTIDIPGLRIDALAVPATMDAAGAADLIAAGEVMTASTRHDTGTTLFDCEPAEWLAALHATAYTDRQAHVARDGDRIVGVLTFEYQRDGEKNVTAGVHVHPDARGCGIEDALFGHAEQLARAHGRTVLNTFNMLPAGFPGEQLPSPAGLGSIARDAESTQLLLRHGYTLGQVERCSVFAFGSSLDRAERMLAEALEKAGPDYRPVWWQNPTPDEYVDSYAYAVSRMATDVPSGELEWEEETWDAERIRYREKLKRDAGQIMAVAVVVHEPTGAIVAFNEIVIGRDRHRRSENYGTLVLKEHRGHRLGTIVKCVGLIRWHELVPTSPSVMTFNAEENRYMLDVNEAVGFVPAVTSGEWKKEL
ncbi:GNAT family N-acetyltransferase [Microbacterium stercoris]|uniref:GNAT family N-acetyltransferase n=1 Tax=Microbacterium stercoris TaxID=2820289 RepID=A0A939QNK0_9MICO|nr:GNAT family N-acetyltransferase [Microbacterium stercoris]MBO3663940.1 GNAT family N-acetyltransferase [Microbacterium stercoris]